MRTFVTPLAIALLALAAPAAFSKDDTTLYEQLGGGDGVSAIVMGMLEQTHTDPRTAKVMENSRIERNAKMITEYVCAKTGGPCEYSGQEMHIAHHGLGITTAHFNALVEHLQKSMDAEGIPFRTQGKLLATLAPDHHGVVVRSRKGE